MMSQSLIYKTARAILHDYGADPGAYEERLLAICGGDRQLAEEVLGACDRLTGRNRKPKPRRTYRRAA